MLASYKWFLLSVSLVAAHAYAQGANEQVFGRYQDWAVYRDNLTPDKSCLMSLRSGKGRQYRRVDLLPSGRPGLVFMYGAADPTLAVPDPKTDKLRVTWLPAKQVHPLPIREVRPPAPERQVLMMRSFLVPSELVRRLLAEAGKSQRLRIELPQHQPLEIDSRGFAEAYAALKSCQPGAQLP